MSKPNSERWVISRAGDHGIVRAPNLLATGLVRHGVTTREGNLSLSFRVDPDFNRVRANRTGACLLVGSSVESLVVPEQIHGAGVATVGAADRGRGAVSPEDAIAGADALVTDSPVVLLGITVADCLPVFLLDPIRPAIGLAHSGWRGTVGGIVPRALALMHELYGTQPERVLAAIGPGIGGDCYEVGEEVADEVRAAGIPAAALRPSPAGRWLLDLSAAVCHQLLASGVARGSVSITPWCTHCAGDLFYSHRRDGVKAGRMMALLALT